MQVSRFYNPFKPHIVRGSFGIYYVRKYSLFFGWEFLYRWGHEIWWLENFWTGNSTIEKAKELLDDFRNLGKAPAWTRVTGGL